MLEERTAVVTLTVGGKELAFKISNSLEGVDLYFPYKLKKIRDNRICGKGLNYYNSSLKDLTANLFKRYNKIIYIMALGIVVRVIAPFLKDKRVDPAVVTIDETGRYVISTLAGHLGGANELTEKIAEILDSTAVITTATDCQGKPAIDLLSKRINASIEPFQNLKLANAAIVNNRPLNIFTDHKINSVHSDNIEFSPLSDLNTRTIQSGFPLIISNRQFSIDSNYLQLIPRNIIIGIGCRRGVTVSEITKAIDAALNILNIKRESIKKLATIDLKEDESGLIAYAVENSLEIDIIKREEIKKADLNISSSEFVEKVIGVPGVCEPAALLSSKTGKLILEKTKFSRVTIAVVEEVVLDE